MEASIGLVKKIRYYIYLYILFLPISSLFSEELKFSHLTVDDGLSQASVTSITQDSLGFMWFGTYDGLSRYDGYNFKIFRNNPDDSYSISDNFVRSLLVDSRDILWIGTLAGGLNIFITETEQFVRINLNTGSENIADSELIYPIFEDDQGSIWVGTWGGGLYKIIIPNQYENLYPDLISNIQIHHFIHNPNNSESLTNNRISDITQDKTGKLWIATESGITVLDPKKEKIVQTFIHESNNPNSINNDNISSIKYANNNIWIGTWGGGLNKYDHDNDRFINYSHNPNDDNSLIYNTIVRLFSDNKGRLWIGTWGAGLDIFVESGKSRNFKHYTHNSRNERSISENYIYNIFQDKTGVIWVGTDLNGVSKYSPDEEEFKSIIPQIDLDIDISSNAVSAIQKDRFGIIWLGTRSDGLIKYNPIKGKIKHYDNDPENLFSINNNTIKTIIEDDSGDLWIGTETGLNYFNRKKEIFTVFYAYSENRIDNIINAIYKDSRDIIWICDRGRGLSSFDPIKKIFKTYKNNPHDPKSISSDIVYCVNESKSNLWIGTENGLNLFNRTEENFRVFKSEKNNSKSLSDNMILSIYNTKNGNIVIGTSNGLNILKSNYDLSGPLEFSSVTRANGLYDNSILGITEDNHGRYWLANGTYLTCIDLSPLNIKSYHGSSVLGIGELNMNSIYKDDQSGEMFFGGTKGFIHFHPDSIKDNQYIPNIAITDLKIFNKSLSFGDTLKSGFVMTNSITHTNRVILSYSENNIAIEFAALHYNDPENNLFAYRLFPYEKEWKIVDYNSRLASYMNLNYGEYIFQVKASNNDKIWNEKGHSLHIIVEPPYWQTWWFRILIFIIIIGILISLYLLRINRIKSINRLLEIQVKERTAQLEASNKELESFAYSVSHDLRAPLRGINGFSKIIEEDFENELSEDLIKYFDKIKNASNRMGLLIDSMLKLSRISRVELNKDQVNLSKIASEIVEELKLSYPNRQINIRIQPNMFAMVDTELIRDVLENIFSNAFKFTKLQFKTIIEFGFEYIHGKNRYYIQDNGVGFDQKFANNLFIPFHRFHSDKEYEGMGIGLASCKKIIDKHNGMIWAKSESNQGTTVYFTLA